MATSLPPVFKLERYFAEFEFSVRHMLSTSDAETIPQSELLAMASPEDQTLWNSLNLGYTESAGHPQLLSAVTKTFYPSLSASQVLACVPQEGIHIAMRCLIHFLSKMGPFHAIATFPAYQSLYEWLRSGHVDLSLWKADDSDPGRWHFDMSSMKALVRENTRLLVVNFPHNPTGFCPETEEWESLVRWCHEQGILLFSDEMYRCTVLQPGQSPLRSACELSPTAITLNGLSKSFGLPGLRSGWLATRHDAVLELCRQYKDYLTICGVAPGEILSIVAVKNHEILSSRIDDIARKNLQVLDKFMEEFGDLFIWRRPRAGLIGLLQMKERASEDFGSAQELADAARTKAEVLLVPSHCMEMEDKYLRIGFGRKNFPEALGLFAKFLRGNAK